MITQDNLDEVVAQMSSRDKAKVKYSDKEYCVLYLSIFNVGSTTTIRLTDDYNRYKNVSKDGNCLLEREDIVKILEKQEELSETINSINQDG